MTAIRVRQEQATDREAVYLIHQNAFKQTNEADLVNALRNSEAFIPELSIVAVIDEKVLGHLLFTRISITDGNASHESLALAPVAVDPVYQSQGIGSALIREGLFLAKKLGFKSIIVLGHEHYYPKFGFVSASRWQIKAPFNVPENAFMALELAPGSLESVSGTVKYAKEFEDI